MNRFSQTSRTLSASDQIGTQRMWKPMTVAALVLLAVSGCGDADNILSGSVSPSVSAAPTSPVTTTEDGKLSLTINPAKVEVPEGVVEAYGEERTAVLAETANDLVLKLDGASYLQVPGHDFEDYEEAWRSSIGDAMDPDIKDALVKDIKGEDGTALVPMWTGDDQLSVDGTDYTVTGEPWVVQYGEPVIEDNFDEHSTAGTGEYKAESATVKYSFQSRYMVPVVDEAGNEVMVSTVITRSIDFLGGYEEQPWVATGMWSSAPSNFEVVEGGVA